MDYNLITNIENCYFDIPRLLYYSHIPTAAAVFFIGIFVYFKNKKLLEAGLLFLMATFFSLWVISDIFIWISPDSRLVIFLWSFVNLFETLVSAFILSFRK